MMDILRIGNGRSIADLVIQSYKFGRSAYRFG